MVLINFLCLLVCPSVCQSLVINMNSDWAPSVPNQNRYTDGPLVAYDYYVTINCLAKGQSTEAKTTLRILVVVLIIF